MSKEKLIVLNSHFQFQWEEKQNSYVLLYPEGMVQLNQSAGEILNLCDGSNDINGIVKILEDKFSTENLKPQIKDFIDEAMSRDWIKYHE